MNRMDKIFKDKLYDMETPLGGRVSFDKVMRQRRTPQWPVWWKPAVLVFATMSAVSLTGYFWISDRSSGTSNEAVAVQHSSQQLNSVKPHNSLNQNPVAAGSEASEESVSQNTEQTVKAATVFKAVQNRRNKPSGNLNSPVKAQVETTKETEGEMADFNAFSSFGIRWSDLIISNTERRSLKFKVKDFSTEPALPKPAVELMFVSGGKSNLPDMSSAYSIRGNHYFGQYSATALWDAGRGFKLGLGLGFTQYKGYGEWQNIQKTDQTRIDTQYITIVQPGLPDKTITVYDTTIQTVNQVTTGNVNYTFDKVSVPFAFRYYLGEGRMLWRLNATFAPGMISYSKGSVFNSTKQQEINGRMHNFSMDARVAIGLEMLMSKRFSLLIEPGLNYQMVSGSAWKGFSRTTKGLGIGLIYKP